MSLLGKLLGRTTSETFGWLETEQLTTLLNDVAPPMVIDVRGPEEFTGPLGHIETAENIPLDQVSVHADRLSAKRRPVVLVCHTDRRSAAAAEHLRRAGVADTLVLRGGMVAWRSRREP